MANKRTIKGIKKPRVLEETGNAVNKTGQGIRYTGKAIQGTGKGIQAAGKGIEVAGKGAQLAGKGIQAGGKALGTAGEGLTQAGAALSSTGLGAIVGVPLSALGAGAKVAGTGAEVAGKGVETAGKGAESAGKATQKAGQGVEKAGRGVENTGSRISSVGNSISNAGLNMKTLSQENNAKSAMQLGKLANQLKNGKMKSGKANQIAKEVAKKKSKKGIKLLVIKFILPVVLLLVIAASLFSIVNSIKDDMIQLLSSATTSISGFVKSIYKWITNDYWIKLDSTESTYLVDNDTGLVVGNSTTMSEEEYQAAKAKGNVTEEKSTMIDMYIKQLGERGISLKDLKLLGEADYTIDDLLKAETDEMKANKALVEKYISEFVRADIITQQPNRRGEKELVKEDNQDWIDGGVFFYRSKKDAVVESVDFSQGDHIEPPAEIADDEIYKQMEYLEPEKYLSKLQSLGCSASTLEEAINKSFEVNGFFDRTSADSLFYKFTIDPDTQEVIILGLEEEKQKGYSFDSYTLNYSPTSESKYVITPLSMDYKSYIQKYTMPYEFLINLCQVTQNPEFVYHVALLARDTEIVFAIQDNVIYEQETQSSETKREKFTNLNSPKKEFAERQYEGTFSTETEITKTEYRPVLKVKYADTWSFYHKFEYKRTIIGDRTKVGPTTEQLELPDEDLTEHTKTEWREVDSVSGEGIIGTEQETIYWEDTYDVEKTTTTETKNISVTYDDGTLSGDSCEKSKQFLGLLRNKTGKCEHDCLEDTDITKKSFAEVGKALKEKNPVALECARDAVFERQGEDVKYKMPNMTTKNEPIDTLLSGLDILYALMESNSEGYLGEDERLETNNDIYNTIENHIQEGDNQKEVDYDKAQQEYANAYITKMQGLVEHVKYLMTFPENEEYDKKEIQVDDEDSDEDSDTDSDTDLDVNPDGGDGTDNIIVKTDEPGAAPTVTKAQLITAINKAYSGSMKSNAMSIIDELIKGQNQNHVNPIFMLAVTQAETSIGTANTTHVNTEKNWTSYNVRNKQVFSSPQENINVTANAIANGSYYFKAGKITIRDIGYTYEGTSNAGTWIQNVTKTVKYLYSLIGISVGDSGNPDAGDLKDIFPDGLPKNQQECEKYIVSIQVPITSRDGRKTTTTLRIHEKVADQVKKALQEIQDAGFKVYDVQGYNYRNVRGSGSISQHSYGLAVDINPNENYCIENGKVVSGSFWKPRENEFSIPKNSAVTKAFKSIGWGWGGNWSSKKDYMHFSYNGK